MSLITVLSLFGFFLGGICTSIIVNNLLLRFSKSLGIRDKQEYVIRWSKEAKPSLGGISFYISFLFTIILFAIVFGNTDVFRNTKLLGLFCAASLAFLMGLADDAYNTKPILKLLAQIICGVIISLTGTTIHFFDSTIINAIITIIWVVGVMNSLNMLDNMDGITTSVSLFILIACFGTSVILGIPINSITSVLLLSLAGSLTGFYTYNWHPAKLFMGDSGSQFIGFVVAYFSIDSLWNTATHFQEHSWIGLFICLVAFTPAASDTLTVFINRIKRGQSPMVGGKDHTTHHLVYRGYSERKVLITFFIISFISAVLAITMVYLLSQKIGWSVGLISVFFFVIFCSLFYNTIKHKPPTDE